MRTLTLSLLLLAACGPTPPTEMPDAGPPLPPWLSDARIFVQGVGNKNTDCRAEICRHNENVDLINWKGAIWLVHRTAKSQVLGPNSSLHIYKSTDGGKSFTETGKILAPTMTDPDPTTAALGDRDLRDPHFYIVGQELFIKALVRKPVTSARDSFVDTVSVGYRSSDGITWSTLFALSPPTWSFWRIKESQGVYYAAAYEDGDKSVKLFSSTDGVTWTAGAVIYDIAVDTPLETELTFMPSGRMLALVRMDGIDKELLGDTGRLRTKVCWSTAPYDTFACSEELTGQRLDGPLSFFWKGRLFHVARKHLSTGGRKRTSLFEITGMLEGGPIAIKEWGEIPSAGDTAYAGVATVDENRFALSWYSGEIAIDETWIFGILDETDIWTATLDLSMVL